MLKYIKGNKQSYIRYGNTLITPAITVQHGSVLNEVDYSAEVIERLLSTGDFEQVPDDRVEEKIVSKKSKVKSEEGTES